MLDCKEHIAYMKPDNVMFHVKVFLGLQNRDNYKQSKLDVLCHPNIYILQKQSCCFSKVFGTTIALLCKFYECSAGNEFMQWELILE